MVQELVNEKARTIELKANSNREFFLVHGYTGSTKDFNELPKYLNKKFNANVKIVRLKGHGTKVQDLDELRYKDFFEQVCKELEKDIAKGRKIALGGVSFGGQLALHLASIYPVEAVFTDCVPYYLRFPFRFGFLRKAYKVKKYWKKVLSPEDIKGRANVFYYKQMHARALEVVWEANKQLRKNLGKIKCPVLTVHSRKDPLADYRCVKEIDKKLNCLHRIIIFDKRYHNTFFSEHANEIYEKIIKFLSENNVFEEKKRKKVLFLYENIGYGHRRVSEVIEKSLNSSNPEVETLCTDVVGKGYPKSTRFIMDIYLWMLSHASWLWHFIHQGKSIRGGNKFFINLAHRLSLNKLKDVIRSFNPDLVVCTHAFNLGLVSFAKRKGLETKLIGVANDFYMHDYWVSDEVNKYCVASKDAKKDLSKRGVGSKKVLVTGIPVEKKFFKKQNKNLIRKKLGLEKDKFLILVIGGGFGKGKVEEAVQALNQTDGDFQIVVVTGTNKELFEKLSKQKYDKDIKIYGFVDNVEELMAVSDILVGKAGGCILAESIAARLPIVIHGSFPANEKNNTNYFVRNKVGFIAENEEQLEEITAGLIHDKKKVLDCKRNIESISMDSAAENVVRVILKELN